MSKRNNDVFLSILNRFDERKPEIAQVMATTTREYLLDQFFLTGGDFGKWPDKEGKLTAGQPATMYDSGNLYDKLRHIDVPGNYTYEGEGNMTRINLKVDALSPTGFDYGKFQQEEKGRIFMEVSYELNEKIKEAVEIEVGRIANGINTKFYRPRK